MNIKLNTASWEKWLHNTKVFLAPVGIIYLVAVIGNITNANGAFNPSDFIPNTFTLGAVSLYVLNSCLDYLRKLEA